MAVATPTGVLTACNPELGRLLGRPVEQLVGSTLFEVTHPDDLEQARASCALMRLRDAPVHRHECRFLCPDGAVVPVLVTTSRVPESDGAPAHLVMHIEDIGERKALEAAIVHRALHDPLTGLANRSLLSDRLAHALARTHRFPSPLCPFLLDLDGFKQVNDAHGHAAGDELLQQFAARLTGILRPGDTAARLGGDEFVVLCEDTDPGRAAVIADRLRGAASRPFEVAGHRGGRRRLGRQKQLRRGGRSRPGGGRAAAAGGCADVRGEAAAHRRAGPAVASPERRSRRHPSAAASGTKA